MQRIAAPCGPICSECEAYKATQADDAEGIPGKWGSIG
jgi:hypothetical protein